MGPIIADSAHKRGIDDEDILHVYRNPMWVFPEDEGFTMLVGPDRTSRLLEIGVVVSDDGYTVIVHAMDARQKYLRKG